ncbi:lysozyme [Pectobacterium carotovorum]|uniref:lysozyme n=1 Tax=Pectobacterium carotovorum TaxID=554 RepID=UPI00027E0B59|nr:lysozyme [Pectobacterium carotovorum]AFR03272.1 Lyz [Pectobacterium carotovorum subsp. carotovorum PCC21]
MSKRKIAAGVICSVSVIIGMVLDKGQLRTNKAGLELIGNAESCRREPYVCPAGVLTDGIGNTHGVVSGTRKTDEQIAADWEKNILVAERCINREFRGRDMSDNTFSAMVSGAFRLGCTGLKTYYSRASGQRVQTSIHKWAQAGSWANMCNHLPDFVNGGGQRLPGLVIRAEKEKALCLSGVQ